MTVVTSGKVLVTGANGFIAIWVVDHLLKRGYHVRAAVRSVEKGTPLTEVFAAYDEKLEIVVIEDITADGVFDSAVKGIDAIMHIASPVLLVAGPPDEIIRPAVKGTTSLLNSVNAHGSSVKRIVFTSSVGAIALQGFSEAYDESNWNDAAVRECEEKGSDALPMYKYCASKVLAERAAWEIFEKHKATRSWDLVVIAPSMVYGPLLQPKLNLEEFTGTMKEWYEVVFKEGELEKRVSVSYDEFYWIDVRDLADAHVKAINVPEAGGERIIVTSESYKWQDWISATRKLSDKAVVGDLSYDPSQVTQSYTYNLAKMERIFGRAALHSKEETVADIVRDFADRGWIN